MPAGPCGQAGLFLLLSFFTARDSNGVVLGQSKEIALCKFHVGDAGKVRPALGLRDGGGTNVHGGEADRWAASGQSEGLAPTPQPASSTWLPGG